MLAALVMYSTAWPAGLVRLADPQARMGSASVGYAPAYFPAAAAAEDAGVVTLGPGADRTNVDIHTTLARFGRIDGLIAGIDGGAGPNSQIQLRPRGWTTSGSFLFAQTTRAASDGRFAFTNVPPGAYTIVVRTLLLPPRPDIG